MFRRVTVAALLALPLSGTAAMAQSTTDTGSGGALGSVQDIRRQIEEQWNGVPGQVVKGTAGVIGLAAALSAANEAVSFEGTMRRDGSVSAGSSIGGSDGGGGATSTSSTTGTH